MALSVLSAGVKPGGTTKILLELHQDAPLVLTDVEESLDDDLKV